MPAINFDAVGEAVGVGVEERVDRAEQALLAGVEAIAVAVAVEAPALGATRGIAEVEVVARVAREIEALDRLRGAQRVAGQLDLDAVADAVAVAVRILGAGAEAALALAAQAVLIGVGDRAGAAGNGAVVDDDELLDHQRLASRVEIDVAEGDRLGHRELEEAAAAGEGHLAQQVDGACAVRIGSALDAADQARGRAKGVGRRARPAVGQVGRVELQLGGAVLEHELP
ncbi:MAG: hypothetical protein IPG96_04285 [Proteobacteria bacterium]|nr:hypothetical protein [Pseudomonadota bacterium]